METLLVNENLRFRITPEEFSEIEEFGKHRNATGIRLGFTPKDDITGWDTGDKTHIYGATGEYVFSKMYGLSLTNRPIDDGYDFILDGFKIDVKFSDCDWAALAFSDKRPFRSDIAVLIVKTRNTLEYRIAGWMTRTEFHRIGHPIPRLRKEVIGLEQKELYPVSTFLERFPMETGGMKEIADQQLNGWDIYHDNLIQRYGMKEGNCIFDHYMNNVLKKRVQDE